MQVRIGSLFATGLTDQRAVNNQAQQDSAAKKTFFVDRFIYHLLFVSIRKRCVLPYARVFPMRLTSGGIFNNGLLLENNRLLFLGLFSGTFLLRDKAVMEGAKS